MSFNCNTFTVRFFLLFFSVALVACEQDDNPSPADNDLDAVSAFLMNDSGLIISLLTDDDDDETEYFDSYRFVFNSDGRVVATNADEVVNGTYALSRDDERIELSLNFPDLQNFDELNDDWYFVSINQNTIRFDDDDDDDGDILEFEQG